MPRDLLVKTESNLRTIAFLGNYLPRKCGIATFTSDLLRAVATRHSNSRCFAVAVNDIEDCYRYPDVVPFEIEEQNLDSYRQAAAFLNSANVDVLSIQHEFGIFGGPAGSHLLGLLRELHAPVVTTLHTVLLKPNADQHRVMLEVVARSARLVVMTERARAILRDVYRAPPAKIDLIPHGIPDMPFAAPDSYKGPLGVGGKKVLLTFGLLSPNKGIEHVLHALPDVVAEFPDVVYIVLGATHPHELRARGEAYRLGLEAIARKNGVEKHVIFDNRFVELQELTEFIGAADLYITPYLDEAQITSGTLAYAFGSGKAVVSTPYWHAAELLKNQRGALVPFADPKAIAREVSGLLRDETRRNAMQANAYKLGRTMVWSNTASLYAGAFERAQQAAHREIEDPRRFRPIAGLESYTLQEKTMAFSTPSLQTPTRLEDVLEHLPMTSTTEYRKGQIIYGPADLSKGLHLVLAGTVGISQIAEDGREVLLDLIRPDELFGESAFIGGPSPCEQAIAIEGTKLMTWPISDMEALVRKRPALAVALLQLLAQRNAELTRRIESLSIDTVERRLARSLIRLSERLGTPEENGSIRMMPFTHVLLSRYIGTTREIVTQHMNRFRKQGYVSYSREGIHLDSSTLKLVFEGRGAASAKASS